MRGIASLLLGCVLVPHPSASTEQAAAKSDPIATLAERLSASPLWRNGHFADVKLPATASTDEVIAGMFEKLSLQEGQVSRFRVLETRLVRIPENVPYTNVPTTRTTQALHYTYIAALVRTDYGDKIVLMKYEGPRVGWWSRVYDPRSH